MKRFSLVLVCLWACDSASPDARIAPPAIDAGPTPDSRPPDAAPSPDASTATLVARGDYLVNAVSACSDCHTPRLATGAPDTSKFLSGAECFIDVMPPGDNGMGCLHSRNLTNDSTGLKDFTDQQIKEMFQMGKKPDGKFLSSVMPYYAFHAYTGEDANAIVAYLRTVPAVVHDVPANEIPWVDPPQVDFVTDADVPPAAGTAPGTTMASAVRGRYLATVVCLECHTPNGSGTKPRDWTKAFAGGQDFQLGIAQLPAHIYSRNITPDATGIMGWTVDDVKKVLSMGKDKANQQLCPPMPFGPMGAFAHLTDGDATDIANYVLNLPAIANTLPDKCIIP